MMFITGLVFGLIAVAVNYLLMYFAVRRIMRRQSGAVRLLISLSYVVRYFVFGALIYLFLRFRLGTVWGLFAGVTVGIIGYLVWQVVNNARNRRSS
jgi:hypothetical protein